MTFEGKLKLFREAKNLTQEQLATIGGVKRTAYAAYETGRVGVPTKVLQKWADYFKITIDELLKQIDTSVNQAGSSDIRSKEEDRYSHLILLIKQIEDRLDTIDANLIHTRHGVELNQSLLKASLFQTAKLESIMTKKSQKSILEDLNKVTAKIFDEMQELTYETNDENQAVDLR